MRFSVSARPQTHRPNTRLETSCRRRRPCRAKRYNQHVGHNRLVLQLAVFAGMGRILITTDVEPRPAVETAARDVCHKIGNQVVTQVVAFVDGGPQFARFRMNRETHRISNARGIDANELDPDNRLFRSLTFALWNARHPRKYGIGSHKPSLHRSNVN
jgi:hypothetical protein